MLIRYPGSKAKLALQIKRYFPAEMQLDLWAQAARWGYREPFFGAGALGFDTLKCLPPDSCVRLNDIDPGVYCLWKSVKDQQAELLKRIKKFRPSAAKFYQFKESDGDRSLGDMECAFRKLALHQMSFSGLGVMAGGPIGGKDQGNAKYRVDCRWNPSELREDIIIANQILNKFDDIEITNLDFEDSVSSVPANAFVYFDPPYVLKGDELYKHSMDEAAHRRLAEVIKRLPCAWALSYDDHPLVRNLYSWASITEIHVTNTIAIQRGDKRPKNREVVITPRSAAA